MVTERGNTSTDDRRALVTGGAGFIGSHLVPELIDDGWTVHVIDNLYSGSREHVPERANLEEIDIRSGKCEKRILDVNPDVIIHLAAIHYIPDCNRDPQGTFEVNVMGTRNILRAAEQVELGMFLFISSGAVYPPQRGVHREHDSLGPDDIYGQTKLIGEDLCRLFHQRTRTPTVTARLFNVYGPNETNEHLIPAINDQLLAGNREIELGNLTPKRDFVHVRDVARAFTSMVRAVDDGYRTYNVGYGSAYSVREVVEYTGKVMDEELRIQSDEERVRETDRPHLEADISKIRDELGWEPEIDFATGLEELLEERGVVNES